MMNKIMLIGEAYGEQEELYRMPFIGPAGIFLNKLLEDAGIRRSDCYVTNVFNLRPKPTNDISNLCGPKSEGIPGREPLQQGKYIRAEFAGELERLEAEVRLVNPNLIVCLGGTAAWAVFGKGAIRKSRGAVATSLFGPKAIATYHPSGVLRDFSLRAITVADLLKAAREADYPEIRRPSREIIAEPTLAEIASFYETDILPAKRLALDIETMGDKITMIGFAPRIDLALVIHFFDPRRPGNVYWQTLEEEREAWRWVRSYCNCQAEKVLQNGLYDLHFLWRRYGIPVTNPKHDTMLLHHALQPESEKGLGFLGSIYTDEASWKLMRRQQTDHAGLK